MERWSKNGQADCLMFISPRNITPNSSPKVVWLESSHEFLVMTGRYIPVKLIIGKETLIRNESMYFLLIQWGYSSQLCDRSRGHHGFLTGDESHQGDESYQGYVWSGRYLDPSPGAVGRTGDALKVWDVQNGAWKTSLSYFGLGNEFQGANC